MLASSLSASLDRGPQFAWQSASQRRLEKQGIRIVAHLARSTECAGRALRPGLWLRRHPAGLRSRRGSGLCGRCRCRRDIWLWPGSLRRRLVRLCSVEARAQGLEGCGGGLGRGGLDDECLALFVARHEAALELLEAQHAFRNQPDGNEVFGGKPLELAGRRGAAFDVGFDSRGKGFHGCHVVGVEV